jgi:hypothetical protein
MFFALRGLRRFNHVLAGRSAKANLAAARLAIVIPIAAVIDAASSVDPMRAPRPAKLAGREREDFLGH